MPELAQRRDTLIVRRWRARWGWIVETINVQSRFIAKNEWSANERIHKVRGNGNSRARAREREREREIERADADSRMRARASPLRERAGEGRVE